MLPRPQNSSSTNSASLTHVPIGQWAVRNDESRIQTLLGSCVGVALFDRQARIGGLAHIVLPDSRGEQAHPGKYADTAIVAMLNDFRKLGSPANRLRLWAKLAGGASMFRTGPAGNIGQANINAVERVLGELGIQILARDVSGEAGRKMTLILPSGIIMIKVPGGAEYEL